MPYYRVLVNGENFWLRFEEGPKCVGFSTTRFVEAEDRLDAESIALKLLSSEGKLRPLNDPDDHPLVSADEIEEIDEKDVPTVVPGFAFFPWPEDEEDEEEDED